MSNQQHDYSSDLLGCYDELPFLFKTNPLIEDNDVNDDYEADTMDEETITSKEPQEEMMDPPSSPEIDWDSLKFIPFPFVPCYNPFRKLNSDLLTVFFSYLRYEDILVFRRTCKGNREFCKKHYFQNQRIRILFCKHLYTGSNNGWTNLNPEFNANWQRLFKTDISLPKEPTHSRPLRLHSYLSEEFPQLKVVQDSNQNWVIWHITFQGVPNFKILYEKTELRRKNRKKTQKAKVHVILDSSEEESTQRELVIKEKPQKTPVKKKISKEKRKEQPVDLTNVWITKKTHKSVV